MFKTTNIITHLIKPPVNLDILKTLMKAKQLKLMLSRALALAKAATS